MEGRRERLLSSIGGPSVWRLDPHFLTPLMMMQFPFFFLLFSFFYYFVQYTYMFPIALIWRVFAIVWVCNHDATLCYYFYYCYDIEY